MCWNKRTNGRTHAHLVFSRRSHNGALCTARCACRFAGSLRRGIRHSPLCTSSLCAPSFTEGLSHRSTQNCPGRRLPKEHRTRQAYVLSRCAAELCPRGLPADPHPSAGYCDRRHAPLSVDQCPPGKSAVRRNYERLLEPLCKAPFDNPRTAADAHYSPPSAWASLPLDRTSCVCDTCGADESTAKGIRNCVVTTGSAEDV